MTVSTSLGVIAISVQQWVVLPNARISGSDAKEKTLGKTQYLDDITLKGKLPGMLYAKILECPYYCFNFDIQFHHCNLFLKHVSKEITGSTT